MAENYSEVMRGLIQAIMDQESDFRPSVESDDGAVGLMQILPQYAHQYGYGVPNIFDVAAEMGFDPSDESIQSARQLLFDPALNERMGTSILNALISHTDGNLPDALTAYNMGGDAYDEWISAGANPSRLDEEARTYAPEVYANYERITGRALPFFFPSVTPMRRPSGLLNQ